MGPRAATHRRSDWRRGCGLGAARAAARAAALGRVLGRGAGGAIRAGAEGALPARRPDPAPQGPAARARAGPQRGRGERGLERRLLDPLSPSRSCSVTHHRLCRCYSPCCAFSDAARGAPTADRATHCSCAAPRRRPRRHGRRWRAASDCFSRRCMRTHENADDDPLCSRCIGCSASSTAFFFSQGVGSLLFVYGKGRPDVSRRQQQSQDSPRFVIAPATDLDGSRSRKDKNTNTETAIH